MFRRIIGRKRRTQDVQAKRIPCKSPSVENPKATKTDNDWCFWMKILFGCIPKKDGTPNKQENCSKPSSLRDSFCLLKWCRRKNKVTPSPNLKAGTATNKSTLMPKSEAPRNSNPPPKPVTKVKRVNLTRTGLPNIGNSCYLNASLQGLMSLQRFMLNVRAQERIWRHSREAGLLRYLQAILDARTSTGRDQRSRLLWGFKQIVASRATEFQGIQQKDAHEFLVALMDQIRSLAPSLQSFAFSLGTTYTCPVEEHMVFKMEKTRTCKRCGVMSSQMEEFTTLSLDLLPGLSTEQLLEHYMKETELEYRCVCGGRTSSQRTTFASLPNVLILHLKRFRFSPSLTLEKVNDDIYLNRDMVVSSKKGADCFSLVSVVSHLGNLANSGHYVCDGQDPEDSPHEPTDGWLTYNDITVCESTGAEVCKKRQNSSYVLFYQRVL